MAACDCRCKQPGYLMKLCGYSGNTAPPGPGPGCGCVCLCCDSQVWLHCSTDPLSPHHNKFRDSSYKTFVLLASDLTRGGHAWYSLQHSLSLMYRRRNWRNWVVPCNKLYRKCGDCNLKVYWSDRPFLKSRLQHLNDYLPPKCFSYCTLIMVRSTSIVLEQV